MWRFSSLIIALCFSASVALAQKTKTVSGSYTYVVPESQSLMEAQETAISRARLEILAKTFGTVMDMSATTSITGEGTEFHALSQSQVKGEWLETVGEPIITKMFDGRQMAIKVEITGKVRELATASSEFTAQLLSAPSPMFEQNSFHNGDNMFLLFQAPGDGFLTVYLYDGADHVFCLLPYHNQSIGAFPVKGGKQYYFFSMDHGDGFSNYNDITEYVLNTSTDLEINRIYVVYSPNRYSRAMDYASETGLRQISFPSFQRWITRIRTEDSSLSVKTINITIIE